MAAGVRDHSLSPVLSYHRLRFHSEGHGGAATDLHYFQLNQLLKIETHPFSSVLEDRESLPWNTIVFGSRSWYSVP